MTDAAAGFDVFDCHHHVGEASAFQADVGIDGRFWRRSEALLNFASSPVGRNRRAAMMSEDAGREARCLCPLFAAVVKPISALCALLLALSGAAQAQQAKKVWRIGILSGGYSAQAGQLEALRQGLHELGYVEGQNIVIEYRYSEGKHERLPDLAAELVRLKADVICACCPGGPTSEAAKKATTTIPIVFMRFGDPVGPGLSRVSLGRAGTSQG